MSTNLAICQDYVREANISSAGTAPTTVISQTGRLLQAVENVKQAWEDVQNRHDNWRWMRAGFTVETSSSDDSYAFGDCTDILTSSAIARFARWRFEDPDDPPKAYKTSGGVSGERWLIWVPWDWFKRIYKRGTQNDGPPSHISIDPQNNLRLGPAPDGAYTVSGDYQRGPQSFTLDADTPDMPGRFHNLLWAYALDNYGMNHAANHLVIKANKLWSRRMRQLENDQLPDMLIGGPMA